MTPLRLSADILLPEGYSEYEIDTDRDLEITFRANTKSDVFINVKRADHIRIRTFVDESAEVSFLFWNTSEKETDIDESYEVLRDAKLTIALGECNSASSKRKTYVALRERNAEALVSSASLVQAHKNYSMNVVNFAPHTHGEIRNYAVVLKTGVLMIDAIGRIVKGAYKSENHQTSRALSFEDGQKSTILPELLIDENDVQASHAMSIGRMDDDQLYYMMSRGLSVEQCTTLISTGYLMPVTEVIDNEELRDKLRSEMERKISELCSM
ncbi:MAG: SufD family Fe-S cluster assembly protein [Erysipelotrichaceae bacterium]|nr:SufD family Fe-S cluster assembly protein [Erysipelotrichaceae bacterium]